MDEKIQRASEGTNIPFQDILWPPVESCVMARNVRQHFIIHLF